MRDPFTDTGPAAKVVRRKKESTLENAARKLAKVLGFWCRKFKSPGKRSAPDGVFSHFLTGPFWIEFKKEGEAPTAKQLEEHMIMRCQGCRVYVCDTITQVANVFNAELRARRNNAAL
jgi:hypothetical protein